MNNNFNNLLKIDKAEQGIFRITLDDQKNKNALSEAMMEQLKNSLNDASDDNSVKVVVIAASGDVFSSGHNLKEITDARKNEDAGKEYFNRLFNLCSSLMQLIINCPKPVIAEVKGIATAAGCQLVASCDLAISSDTSKFATPGVNIGLFCSTPMVALSRTVNRKDAMKMLLTGDMISAKEAKRLSLINDHMPEDQVTTAVMELAKKIASKSLNTLKIGKEAFYIQSELSLSDAYDYASKVMVQNTLKDSAKEGIDAFLKKRDPNWSNE